VSGWFTHPIEDIYSETDALENCLGSNHTKKYCSPAVRCAKCGKRHETAVCQAQSPRCRNCLAEKVHASKEECAAFKKLSEKIAEKVKQRSRQAHSATKGEF
jgi:hypothetical protein